MRIPAILLCVFASPAILAQTTELKTPTVNLASLQPISSGNYLCNNTGSAAAPTSCPGATFTVGNATYPLQQWQVTAGQTASGNSSSYIQLNGTTGASLNYQDNLGDGSITCAVIDGDFDCTSNITSDTLISNINSNINSTTAWSHFSSEVGTSGSNLFSTNLSTFTASFTGTDLCNMASGTAHGCINVGQGPFATNYSGGLLGLEAGNNTANTLVIGAAGIVNQIAAKATSDTQTFWYMPSVAGVPTGTPYSTAPFNYGKAAVYDSTDNRFYVYNSGWHNLTPVPATASIVGIVTVTTNSNVVPTMSLSPSAAGGNANDCPSFTDTAGSIGDNGNAHFENIGPCVVSDAAGHPALTLNTAPTVSGTGCTGSGSPQDNTGAVVATGADTCTIAFGASYATAPHCTVSGYSATVLPYLSGAPTTAHLIVVTAAAGTFSYICL